MEGRVKILETHPKPEDINTFTPHFHVFADFIHASDNVEQNCHVLVMTLYNLKLARHRK